MTSDTFYRIWWTILLVAFLLLAGRTILFSAPPPIKLDVMPKFLTCIPSQRPQIRIRVTIERDPANRGRSLSWSGLSGDSGTSLNQMEGENDARTFERFQEVSCTSYTVTACVYRNDGKKVPCVSEEVISTEGR